MIGLKSGVEFHPFFIYFKGGGKMNKYVFVIMVGRWEDIAIYKIFPNLRRAKRQLGRMPKGYSCPRLKVFEFGKEWSWELEKRLLK